jgi:RNA polymerase sigma-70 factor (ECF subfamily)
VPQSELDDEIQRTFIAVSRRLEDVQLGSERSFVFQVAVNMASHARRNLARRREVCTDELPDEIHVQATPENLTERKQIRELLDHIVARWTRTRVRCSRTTSSKE